MTVRELFDFITDLNLTDAGVDAYLERSMEVAANRTHEETTNQEKIDAEVGARENATEFCIS